MNDIKDITIIIIIIKKRKKKKKSLKTLKKFITRYIENSYTGFFFLFFIVVSCFS